MSRRFVATALDTNLHGIRIVLADAGGQAMRFRVVALVCTAGFAASGLWLHARHPDFAAIWWWSSGFCAALAVADWTNERVG